ncbi:hypothetical protein [Sphingobium boeckii]|uniref:Sugar transporter n=1 Tax=Sphingobium boeckii TaxID=1082345 RepID=A0A7W9AL33_9SPHN|nr:hypothetical protein [Sphingobium boeckii]MBB5687508.1 hypothetical protein [Sphingobium boeckii]
MDLARDEARTAAKTPWHLWAVSLISALWNCGGVFDFTMTNSRNADYLAGFSPEMMTWVDAFPLWSILAWGAGVFGALAGSLLLLARSRWAVLSFAVSLAGLMLVTIYQFALSDRPASLTSGGEWLFSAALHIVAILLLYYALRMRTKGVLR